MEIYLEHDESINFCTSFKRLMSVLHLKFQSRIKRHHHIKQDKQELRDNILNQEFNQVTHRTNQVLLSDYTVVAYGVNSDHKIWFWGILGLYGRYLLAYNLNPTETQQDGKTAIKTFTRAFENAGEVRPMVHWWNWA